MGSRLAAGIRASLAPLAPPPSPQTGRLAEFDGVRGWAALSVVFYHVFWETLYVRAPEMRNVVSGALMDGGLAVSLFFVLSAEAISAPYFQGRGDAVVRGLAIKRYTRLAIPVFCATVLTYLLTAAGLNALGEAASIVGRAHWMNNWLQFPLTLAGLFRYSLFEVFYLWRPADEWNPFLWTMGVELNGSLLVFAILLFARQWPGLRIALIVAAIYLALGPTRLMQNFSCFLVGLLFADFRARGGFARLATPGRQKLFGLCLIAVFLSIGVANDFGHHDQKNLKAFALLFTLSCMPAAGAFFRLRVSQFLGRISFPLYLVQFAVIISPMSAAIGFAERHGGLDRPWAYAIGAGAMALSLAAAWAFLPVERLTARVGAALARAARPASAGEVAAARG